MLLFLLASIPAHAEPTAVPCCDDVRIQSQLTFYLKVQSMLADGTGIGKLTGEFYGWAPTARSSASEARGADAEALKQVAELTQSLKNARNREQVIEAFPTLSRAMSALVVRHTRDDRPAVYEAHCGDRVWLQRDPATLHPPYPDCEGTWRSP